MPTPTSSVLLEQAFAPARINTINMTEKLKIIYQDQEPCYANDATGTVAESKEADEQKPRFSAEDVEKINRFNAQFEKLIITLAGMQIKYNFSYVHIVNLTLFNQRIQDRNYYTKQSGLFYCAIKHEIEGIVTALMAEDPTTIRENKPIIHDLLDDIANCGPGIFGHLKITNNLLNNVHNIESWLAQLRETIIRQFANSHIVTKEISQNDSIHVYNVFYIYACEQKWNPLGFQSQDAVNEIHRRLARVTDTELETFRVSFFKSYNPYSIVSCISENLHAAFSAKIAEGNEQNTGGLKFQDLEEFNEYFSALPLVKSKGIFDVVFTAAELDEKAEAPTSNLTFIFANYRYQLKSLASLKLSLTRFYLTPASERLFQGFYENIDDDSSYGIVPGTPELCYLYYSHSDSFLPLSQSQPGINLNVFRYHQIPLTQTPFEMYVNTDHHSFHECILENIDLRQITEHTNLNFIDATLINVKVTPSEFFGLFFNKCNKSKSNLIIDHEANPTLQDIVDGPGYIQSFRADKHSLTKLLSFAAHTLDNFEFISRLIIYGARLDKQDRYSVTPIQAARHKKHWQTVKAIAKQTSALLNKNDKQNLGDPLVHCLEFEDFELAEDLLRANASADDRWYSMPSRNTALHWAAEHNIVNLVEYIALANANLGALNSADCTPIQVAAFKGHWVIVEKLASLFVEPELNKYHYGSALLQAAKKKSINCC